MPKLTQIVPKLRHHKATGHGVVTLNGRDFYLGAFGQPETKSAYDKLIARWLENGRELLNDPDEDHGAVTISDLVVNYWDHVEHYYRRPDGKPTQEPVCIRLALRPLVELHGDTPVSKFGPLALKAVRQRMIEMGWCRTHINRQITKIKTMFRWGTEEELVPGEVYHALQAVSGLKRGRSDAKESDPVKPVPRALIDPLEQYLSRQVWAMIQLQLLTGMRPGEVLQMRPADLDMSGHVWVYTPQHHKTAHHGHQRSIYLGPQAQKVIQPFILGRPITEPLFSPREAERERRAELAKRRRTPLSCGNREGTNRRRIPYTRPRDHYDVYSYRRAIARACAQAFLPPKRLRREKVKGGKGMRWETDKEWRARIGEEGWSQVQEWQKEHRWHPHQLRHTAATELRKKFGIEAARTVLGHRSAAVTEVYAEMDQMKAAEVMGKVG